jgi:diadenosine tetraphosphate (Ap4A) HIT family hydrolase
MSLSVDPKDCPFCALLSEGRSLVARSAECAALRDKTPLSKGHTLIVPVRHESDFLALTAEELNAIMTMALAVRGELDGALHPDGFNIGANIGEAGGQTVGHAHLHVIPRFDGDVADPRGGIRWVLPDKAVYW